MFYMDDLRDWVGYLDAHPGVHTPNIDALAARSLSFDRAYTAVPACLGSRVATLWSQSPVTTGVEHTGIQDPAAANYKRVLRSGLKSLPEVLSDEGYTTFNTGKFFHAPAPERWDVSRPYEEISSMLRKDTPEFAATLFDYGVLEPGEVHADQITADWFCDQLRTDHQAPFFFGVGLYQPHVPWRVPAWAYQPHPIEDVVVPETNSVGDLSPTAEQLQNRPLVGRMEIPNSMLVDNSGRSRELVQAYLAAITHTDAMIGQVLRELRNSPYAENTIVVLATDHGYHLGEKLHWRKCTLWEESTRIPLLVSGPGTHNGQRVTEPVSMIDLAPTILDLAGLAPHPDFQGRSLLPLAAGEDTPRPVMSFWEGHRSMRVGPWRLIQYVDGSAELYDHRSDPREATNLVGDASVASEYEELSKLMDETLVSSHPRSQFSFAAGT